MADEVQIYGLDKGLNSHGTLTTEQILAAIQRAVTTGEISAEFQAFIQMIKEQNKGVGLKFWLGTSAEFNALENTEADTVYLITDNTSLKDVSDALTDLETQLSSGAFVVKKAQSAESAKSAESASSAGSAGSATNAANVTARINNKAISDIFESDGKTVKEASHAESATSDGIGRNIEETYATKEEVTGGEVTINDAINVTKKINNVLITDIFEDDGQTAKNATHAETAGSAQTAVTAGHADTAGTADTAGSAENAKKVNDLEIKIDENGVLKIGDIIIPQKKLLWSGEITVKESTAGLNVQISSSSILNKTLEFEYQILTDNASNPSEPSAEYVATTPRRKSKIIIGSSVPSSSNVYNYVDLGRRGELYLQIQPLSTDGRISVSLKGSSVDTGFAKIYKIYEVIE